MLKILPQNNPTVEALVLPAAKKPERPHLNQRGKNPLSLRGQDAQEARGGRDATTAPGTAFQSQTSVYNQQIPHQIGNSMTFNSLPQRMFMKQKQPPKRVRSREPTDMLAGSRTKQKDRLFEFRNGPIRKAGGSQQFKTRKPPNTKRTHKLKP